MKISSFLQIIILIIISSLAKCYGSSENLRYKLPKLRVIIIGVYTHADSLWNDKDVDPNIKKTSEEVKEFFEINFPESEIHFYNNANNTTKQSIKDSLQDLRPSSIGQVTLLFILSHGIDTTYNPVSKDLLIATSNTIKRDMSKSISFRDDILTFIDKSQQGSISLVYLDTCSAGSAIQRFDKNRLAELSDTNINVMIVGASSAKKKTYATTFTRTLLSIWKSSKNAGDCLNPKAAVVNISEKMQELHGFGQDDGQCEVLFDYPGDFCFENFSEHTGLLVLTNYAPKEVSFGIVNENGIPLFTKLRPVKSYGSVPYRLNKGKYRVRIYYDRDYIDESYSIEVGTRRYFGINVGLSYGGALSPSLKGNIFYNAYQYAYQANMDSEILDSLGNSAYTYLTISGDTYRSSQMALRLIEGRNSEILRNAYSLAFKNIEEIDLYVKEKNVSRTTVAQHLKIKGDYLNAATLHIESAKIPDRRNEELAQAYVSYLAANEVIKAKKLRSEADSELLKLCDRCPRIEEKLLGDPFDVILTKKIQMISVQKNISQETFMAISY